MIRTIKIANVTVCTMEENALVTRTHSVVANNNKEIKTELNKIYGRAQGTYMVTAIIWCERTYELDDEIFFKHAKIVKDTSTQEQ
jgi:hypothetical protein